MSTHALNTDAILAAIFDPQLTPTDLPAKTGLSLPQLARWLKANADTVNEVREFLTQRAALIGTRLHTASLGALDRVIRECPDLERVRKAASTILRSLASTNPTRKRGAPCVSEREGAPVSTSTHHALEHTEHPEQRSTLPKRSSPAERLAAMRLAKLNAHRLAPAS